MSNNPYDPFLLLLSQIRRHRQTQALGCDLFGYREIARFVAKVSECALEMQGSGVVSD